MTINLNNNIRPAVLPEILDMWLQNMQGVEIAPEKLEEAQETILELFNASEYCELMLTQSGAEAINQVIHGVFLEVTRKTGKNQFITSNLENAATIMSCARLEKMGCVTKFAEADANGYITQEEILRCITPRTACISLSLANIATGMIQPIQDIAAICKERGIFFHIDVSLVLPAMKCDIAKLEVDAITFDGQMLHGLPSGAVIVPKSVELSPIILGMQANNALLLALALSVKKTLLSQDFLSTHICQLRNQFEEKLLNQIPGSFVLSESERRLPHLSCIYFPQVYNEALYYLLQRRGVQSYIGGEDQQRIADLLLASGFNQSVVQSSLGFTLSRFTQEEEIDQAVMKITGCYNSLLAISQGVFS